MLYKHNLTLQPLIYLTSDTATITSTDITTFPFGTTGTTEGTSAPGATTSAQLMNDVLITLPTSLSLLFILCIMVTLFLLWKCKHHKQNTTALGEMTQPSLHSGAFTSHLKETRPK